MPPRALPSLISADQGGNAELSPPLRLCSSKSHLSAPSAAVCPSPAGTGPGSYRLWLLSSVQGRASELETLWLTWDHTIEKNEVRAASWTSTTWQACSTCCWQRHGAQPHHLHLGASSSTGSCASAQPSWASAPTGRACSSPLAGSVSLTASSPSAAGRSRKSTGGSQSALGDPGQGVGGLNTLPSLTNLLDVRKGHWILCS